MARTSRASSRCRLTTCIATGVPLGVKPARLKKSVDSHHGEVEEALGQRKTAQLKRLLEAFIEESARR